MSRVNKRKLLVGLGLITAGVIVVGVGLALGTSVGGAILAGVAAAA